MSHTPGTPGPGAALHRTSFWPGVAFVALGVPAAVISVIQHRVALASLRPAEVPPRYRTSVGVWLNALIALFGVALIAYLASG